MIRSIPRAVAVALLGALAGPLCLVGMYARNVEPAFGVERVATIGRGFYALERAPDGPFVWTSPRAEMAFAGLDRRSAWSCTVRFRGARPGSIAQPDLLVALDGVAVATRRATNDFQDLEVAAPERPTKPGLVLTLTSSTTFVPGPSDTRSLGVQVNAIGCRPADAFAVMPPRGALWSSALAAGIFGLAFGFTGITAGSAVGATVLLAAAQAVPLSVGAAPYSDYTDRLVLLAVWIALLMVVALKSIEAFNRQALRHTARFAVLFSAGAIYLKLLALLHPSKALVDALFHAHRFEAVLDGHWYFTQLSTSATPFPYAIGLYLFAVPWSVLTRDHVALLRIVVCASQAVAGGLLYLIIVRTWGDRLVGAIAVALFGLVPISYVILGYANLTNAFGSAVALVTMAALTVWPMATRRLWQLVGLILVATLAFVSHVSTIVLLLPAMVLVALLYRTMGGDALRAPARNVLVAAAVALVLSIALYWGHFGEVYQAQIARMRTQPVAANADPPRTAAVVNAARGDKKDPRPALGHTTIPLHGRIRDAFGQSLANLGWPILILAVAGAWRLIAVPRRDRLVFALLAWGGVLVAAVAASVLLPRDMKFQQDAWEFTARVEDLTSPLVVILAAYGAAWAWRAALATRIASIALLFAAVVLAIRLWAGWI